MNLREAIARVVDGRDLVAAEMQAAMGTILDGGATPAQIAAFLVALRMKGESVEEIAAAAESLRAAAIVVPGVPAGAVDTCGTGGDGATTFNISTAAALVVAAAGVPVAKHGNRAASGAVGGADVLEALGVTLVVPPEALGACLASTGFAFLFAPALHPALRHAAGPRREVGVRTLFNLLGPLCNPAGVRRQVVGVSAPRWLDPMAEVLQRLGTEHAWVVHGAGGVDEIGLEGDTAVVEVDARGRRSFTVHPADAGLRAASTASLRVASVAEASACVRGVLAGTAGPARDVVCLNAAAALVVADRVPDLHAGAKLAVDAIDSGRARAILERVVTFTSAYGPGAGEQS